MVDTKTMFSFNRNFNLSSNFSTTGIYQKFFFQTVLTKEKSFKAPKFYVII